MNKNQKNYSQTQGVWAVEESSESDDDDKDIEEMQKEVEDILSKITSNKRKEPNTECDPPMQFSIKVEVEEYQEPPRKSVKIKQNTNQTTQNLDIQTVAPPLPHTSETTSDQPSPIILHYMNTKNISLPVLPEVPQPNIIKHYLNTKQKTKETQGKPNKCMTPKSFNDFTYDRYNIKVAMRKLSETSENIADKYIEYLMLNIENRPREGSSTPRERALQKVLRLWRDWYMMKPDVREAPLLYKCRTCGLAWWYLAELEDHMDTHYFRTSNKISVSYSFETANEESHISAKRIGSREVAFVRLNMYLYGSFLIPNMRTTPCWRCGLLAEEKYRIYSKDTLTYNCVCRSQFGTCIAYRLHRDVCKSYNKDVKRHVIYKCHLCFITFNTSKELMEHKKISHTVRTDIPIVWPKNTCINCTTPIDESKWHDCPNAIPHVPCPYCLKKFSTVNLLDLHSAVVAKNVKCRLCDHILEKACMELTHMVQHTENYKMLYKCTKCKEEKYFLDVPTYNIHLLAKHPSLDKPAYQVPVPVTYLAEFGYTAPARSATVYKTLEKEEDDVKIVEVIEQEEKEKVQKVKKNAKSSAERTQAYRERKRIREDAANARLMSCVEGNSVPNGNMLMEKIPSNSVVANTGCSQNTFAEHPLDNRFNMRKCEGNSVPNGNMLMEKIPSNSVVANTGCSQNTFAEPPLDNRFNMRICEDDVIIVEVIEQEEKEKVQKVKKATKSSAERVRAYRERKRIARFESCVRENSIPKGNMLMEKIPSNTVAANTGCSQNTIAEPPLDNRLNMKKCKVNVVYQQHRIAESSLNKGVTKNTEITVSVGNEEIQIENSHVDDLSNVSTIEISNIKSEENIEEYIDNNDELNEFKPFKNDENDKSNDNNIEIMKAVENITNNEENKIELNVNCDMEVIEILDDFEVDETVEIKQEISDSEDNDDGRLVIADINDLIDDNIKVEVKEEPEEFYEDDIIILHGENVNVSDLNIINNDNFECNDDSNVFDDTNYDMRDSNDEEYNEDEAYGEYDCKQCNFETTSFAAYRVHKENFCRPGRTKRFALDDIDEFDCSKCMQKFQSMKTYLKHLPNHKYATLSCPECMSDHQQWSKLIQHVVTHITRLYITVRSFDAKKNVKTFRFQCKKCHKDVELDDFFRHWEQHLELPEEKLLETDWQKYAPESPILREFIAHILGVPYANVTEEDRKLHWCKLCRRHFNRRNEVKRHFIEHLLEDAYANLVASKGLKCQICGEIFGKNTAYKSHMRNHASLPVYKCDLCKTCFSDSSNFSKHKKVHNFSVYICDVCKKKFSLKHHLINHIETHVTQKPIVCEVEGCLKVFYCKGSYKKHHRQKHQKTPSKFTCQICKERFTALKDKWDHQWLAHRQRKLIADCPICKKPFRKFADVKTHLRLEHNIVHDLKKLYTLSEMERRKNLAQLVHKQLECGDETEGQEVEVS